MGDVRTAGFIENVIYVTVIRVWACVPPPSLPTWSISRAGLSDNGPDAFLRCDDAQKWRSQERGTNARRTCVAAETRKV